MEKVAEELRRILEYLEALKLLAEVVAYLALGALLLFSLYLVLASATSFAERAIGQLRP